MGTHVIKMPDIGEGIAEVELSVWHVKVGDMVVEDQVLADVMTDKAMVDIPSPVHGKVIALGGVPGEVMAVGSILISIEVEGAGNVKESAQPAPVKEAPVAAPKVAAVVESKPVAAAAPRAAVCQGPMVAREADERPLASPAVRKHALDLGIQLRLVRGSGPAGRVLHEDLDAYLAQGQSNASTVPPLTPSVTTKSKSRSSACAARLPSACRTPPSVPHTSVMSKKSTSPPSKNCART